jgi:tripartite-type tricarboxylate transporter receptor subunit TctC
MKRSKQRHLIILKCVLGLALCGFILPGLAGAASAYPVKPITVIVAYSAGGGSDLAARLLNQYAEKQLKQPLVVVNKAGAGGEIGSSELGRSRPDGYTIGWLSTPNIVSIPIQRKATYSMDDFTPICNVISDPGVIAIRADSPLDTIEKVFEEAKKLNGAMTYGTTGIGSDDHIAMLNIQREIGAKMTHIVFDGGAQTTVALLGGHISVLPGNEGEVLPLVRAGKVKIIAAMSEKRLASLPNVPTLLEKGIKVTSFSARGVAAPKGTPAPIISILEESFMKVKDNPEFLEKAKKLDLPLLFMDSKSYAEFLKKQEMHYRSIWEKEPWM